MAFSPHRTRTLAMAVVTTALLACGPTVSRGPGALKPAQKPTPTSPAEVKSGAPGLPVGAATGTPSGDLPNAFATGIPVTSASGPIAISSAVLSLGGVVKAPPGILNLNGGAILNLNGGAVADLQGGNILNLNGGALIDDAGTPILNLNGGAILNLNGGAILNLNGGAILNLNGGAAQPAPFRLFGLEANDTAGQALLANCWVYVIDARGGFIATRTGEPVAAKTDERGHFRFEGLPDRPLFAAAVLPGGKGRLLAALTQDRPDQAVADLDLISTLTTGYIYQQYVAPGKDPRATLARLPAVVEAETRERAIEATRNNRIDLATGLGADTGTRAVEVLRAGDRAFDGQMDTVKRLLVIGAESAVLTDGDRLLAQFNAPKGVAFDTAGTLYVADTNHHLIRTISAAGRVATLAGRGTPGAADGHGQAAEFRSPEGLCVLPDGAVIVADTGNHVLRRIALDGTVTTLAGLAGVSGFVDGPPVTARFFSPIDLACDRSGTVYVADVANQAIRKVAANGGVSTLAGGGPNATGMVDGPGTAARFWYPRGLDVAPDGRVLVADTWNHRIRAIAPEGQVTTFAGDAPGNVDGPRQIARFEYPEDVAWLPDGSLAITEFKNKVIRVITPSGLTKALTKEVATGSSSYFTHLAVSPVGGLFVADLELNSILAVSADGAISRFAGDGQPSRRDGAAANSLFAAPEGLARDAAGNLYVADTANHAIRRVSPLGEVTTLAGHGTPGSLDGPVATAQLDTPVAIAVGEDGRIIVGEAHRNGASRVREISVDGMVRTLGGGRTSGYLDAPEGGDSEFHEPRGIALLPGGDAWIADMLNGRIRRVTAKGHVFTLAGGPVPPAGSDGHDGRGEAANFVMPRAIAAGPGGVGYVLDDHRVRRVTADGEVVTLAGGVLAGRVDGRAGAASFNAPCGLVVGPNGILYVADTGNRMLRAVTPQGVVTTLPLPPEAPWQEPVALVFDGVNGLWVLDRGTNQIRSYRLP